MWSNLARLASPGPRKPSTPTLRADEATFSRLYDSIRALLGTPSAERTLNLVSKVRLELGQLLGILKVETAEGRDEGLLGPCIEFALRVGAFECLVELGKNDDPLGVRIELVEWFKRAIVELDEGFLAQSAVNKPLIKLLRACIDQDGGLSREDELTVVETMCVVCERIKTRPELLAIFLRHKPSALRKDLSPSLVDSTSRPPFLNRLSSQDENGRPTSPTLSQVSASEISTSFSMSNASSSTSRRQRSERDFLLFAYLLRFIHREGEVGELARRGILALCDVALGYPDVYSPSFSSSSALPRSTSEATITPSSSGQVPSPYPSSSTREAVLAFAEYLLDSDFAEVLGAGLGALYGLLPNKLVVRKATNGGGQSGEVVDGIETKSAGGMQLGGMGPLGEETDAEELERKREEEEDRLRSTGVGFSGTSEVRDGLDGFLKLVEFTQEVLKRCSGPRTLDDAEEGSAVDDSDDSRQRALLLSALTDSILTALRDLFLNSVLYPSILECSETDGSAVAVMSYLDALLEVVTEGSKLEGTVLGFLLGEDEVSLLDRPRQPPFDSSPRPARRRINPRKSSALLLIEQASMIRRPSSSSYSTKAGRYTLRDLLVSHLHSISHSTATSALKLLGTVLTHHDRWSLALLDVVLDEGATSFPLALRQSEASDSPDGISSVLGQPSMEEEEEDTDDDSDEEFVYPSSDPTSASCLPASTSALRPSLAAGTPPRTPFRSNLGSPLPPTPSVAMHLDHLDTLLSLVSSIDPSYRQIRSAGGGSEMLSSGFANYLGDAETSLAADRGFRRGVLADPDSDDSSAPLQARKRSTLFSTGVSLRGRDYASTKTGRRHKVKPNGELVALLLDSFSHFFSHAPDVNLALTAVISTLATYPYRSLDGWLLPVVRSNPESSDFEHFVREDRTEAASSFSDDGDDRSVDYEIEERNRQHSLLSPHPRTPQHFDVSNLPPSATRAALPQSDSLLSILDALVSSVQQYRARVPEFDTYLSDRRKGLFFVENLADALHLDDLAASDSSFSSPEPAPPLPTTPVSKPKPSGLASFFSPRRPSHNRSPSTPLNKSLSNPQPSSAPPRPSQLRRSASNGSISVGLPVPSTTSKGPGPASPFVAHYRQTGSITVEPVIVSTPGAKHRSTRLSDQAHGEESDGEEEEIEADVGGVPDSPSRRLSPLPPPPPKKHSSASSTSDYPSRNSVKPRQVPTVTLSTILDNVIVLEEFIKELTAIIYVRREVGIDQIRFV